MERIAKFEKVSFTQFKKDFSKNFNITDEKELRKIYDGIVLPKRSTKGSAGYDFTIPSPITLKPGETIIIPTGIRCRINDGWSLWLMPRSGLGFKYRVQLDNTIGLIDADYYGSDNEGHIMAKVTNDGHEGKEAPLTDRFCQGVFLPFGITEDDEADGVRNGGMGSTDNKIHLGGFYGSINPYRS